MQNKFLFTRSCCWSHVSLNMFQIWSLLIAHLIGLNMSDHFYSEHKHDYNWEKDYKNFVCAERFICPLTGLQSASDAQITKGLYDPCNVATLPFYNGRKTRRANCAALQVSLTASPEDWCAVSVFHAKLTLGSQICWQRRAWPAIWDIWPLLGVPERMSVNT